MNLIWMLLCPLLICHFDQVWYWYLYALFWDALLVRFYINVVMAHFEIQFLEMPFLLGFILMFYALFWDAILVRFYINVLCSILRCHSCQVWYWCVYSHLWDDIIARYDIDIFMPSFERSFLSGLILMFVCPLLRCHSCQVWYWCVYALFWDAIFVMFDIDVFMTSKHVKDIFLSMCDVKIFLTFTSQNMVLLWKLFYLFCSCI